MRNDVTVWLSHYHRACLHLLQAVQHNRVRLLHCNDFVIKTFIHYSTSGSQQINSNMKIVVCMLSPIIIIIIEIVHKVHK